MLFFFNRKEKRKEEAQSNAKMGFRKAVNDSQNISTDNYKA